MQYVFFFIMQYVFLYYNIFFHNLIVLTFLDFNLYLTVIQTLCIFYDLEKKFKIKRLNLIFIYWSHIQVLASLTHTCGNLFQPLT